jgi:hypothetical protein
MCSFCMCLSVYVNVFMYVCMWYMYMHVQTWRGDSLICALQDYKESIHTFTCMYVCMHVVHVHACTYMAGDSLICALQDYKESLCCEIH